MAEKRVYSAVDETSLAMARATCFASLDRFVLPTWRSLLWQLMVMTMTMLTTSLVGPSRAFRFNVVAGLVDRQEPVELSCSGMVATGRGSDFSLFSGDLRDPTWGGP